MTHAISEDADQTAWMRRLSESSLIARRVVDFVMRLLNLQLQ